MKISTKGRYALRLLLDLAAHRGESYVALRDAAQREEISKKYLEQIVPVLCKAGLLQTSRGFRGGYRLAAEPAEIRLGAILRATEGSLEPVACLDQQPNSCPRRADCPTLPVWEGLSRVICDYVDGVTLQDILDQQRSRCGSD